MRSLWMPHFMACDLDLTNVHVILFYHVAGKDFPVINKFPPISNSHLDISIFIDK